MQLEPNKYVKELTQEKYKRAERGCRAVDFGEKGRT